MKIGSVVNFVYLSVSLCVFNSCATPQQVATTVTVESAEIPPDMATEQFIIIGTLKNRNSYDKYMKKEFANYSGKYILADKNEIATRYQDVSKYRYIMDYTEERGGSLSAGTDAIAFRYYIKDRKTDKNYQRKGRSSFFAREMRAYLQAIEAVRKK